MNNSHSTFLNCILNRLALCGHFVPEAVAVDLADFMWLASVWGTGMHWKVAPVPSFVK